MEAMSFYKYLSLLYPLQVVAVEELRRCEGLWPPCVYGLALCRSLHGPDDWIPMSDRLGSTPLLPGLSLDLCSVELVPSPLPLPDFLILCICDLDKTTNSESLQMAYSPTFLKLPLPAHAFRLSVFCSLSCCHLLLLPLFLLFFFLPLLLFL